MFMILMLVEEKLRWMTLTELAMLPLPMPVMMPTITIRAVSRSAAIDDGAAAQSNERSAENEFLVYRNAGKYVG